VTGVTLLFFAILAAAGAFVTVAALLQPAAEAEIATDLHPAGFVIRTGRAQPYGLRDRIDQSFKGIIERSNQRRLKKTGLTLDEHLARADLKLRASEFVLIQIGFLVVFTLLGLLRYGFGPQFIVSGVGGYLIPMRFVRYRQRKRLNTFNRQLPDTLSLLANGLKAGFSLPQALDSVSHNTQPPLSEELGRVVREMNIGVSLEQALHNLLRRVPSDDLDLIVTAILIHNSVGGNLARVLDSISHTIRQRVQVKAQAQALTSQARASGWVITLLPVVVAGILYLIAPDYFRVMTTDRLGLALLVVAGVMIGIGNYIIRRIVNIKV
jgi:tight adherence protein B